MARPKLLFPLLTLIALCGPAQADPKADHLLKRVEATIAAQPALTVYISATVRDKRPNRNPLAIYKATALLARPNLARIDYGYFSYIAAQKSDGAALDKHNGVVAADGKSLWSFDAQKNQFRKSSLSPSGDEISIENAFPLDSLIYSFFHGHVPHTDTPPAYVGEQTWNKKAYRVIEFRQGADSPNGSPILQRLYIGPDNLIHRFVNIQMNGQYVEDCAMSYVPTGRRISRASFAYSPPAGASEYIPPPPPMLTAGTVAPDLTAVDRAGKPVELSALRGKVVVLDFWAIGCGHCLESQAHLNDVANKFAGDAVVVALDVQDSKPAFTAWLAKHPQYPALLFAIAPTPKDQEMAMVAYEVPGFPETYIIGKDGKIVKAMFGYGGPTPDLANAIRDALKAS